MQCYGAFPLCVFALSMVSLFSKRRDGHYFSWLRKEYFAKESGAFIWKNLFSMLALVVVDFVSYFFYVYSYKFALEENINQGIIMSVFSFIPVFIAIAFYFAFGQKLKIFEVTRLCKCLGYRDCALRG